MTASRINIRHTPRGVTIRATGAAAQALADAITHGAEQVRHNTLPPAPQRLVVEVVWNGMHYGARALVTSSGDEERAGLTKAVVVSNTDEHKAVESLLKMAKPPLRVKKWISCCYLDRGRKLEFTLEAETL